MSWLHVWFMLQKLVDALNQLHESVRIPTDSFSVKEAYYHKTMGRRVKIEDLVPFPRDRHIYANEKQCRNIFYSRRKLERDSQSSKGLR